MRRIEPAELTVRPFHILDQEWALLVGGREQPNPMTVSWGGLGTLWNRPVATVYVCPTRFTYGLLEAHPEFTLCFLPPTMKAALDLDPARFLDATIESLYPLRDYHRAFIGEVVAAWAAR